MSESLKESLSALMDDEADDLELRRVLKRLPEDSELQEVWARYHLVSASLRREVHARPGVDLLSGIQAALADDAAPVMTPSGQEAKTNTYWRPLGQAAIAASVAVAVLFTAHNFNSPVDGSIPGQSQIATGAADQNQGARPGFIPANSNEGTDLGRVAVLTEDGQVLDSAARDRLRQAVYQQFEETPLAVEIPVNFIER